MKWALLMADMAVTFCPEISLCVLDTHTNGSSRGLHEQDKTSRGLKSTGTQQHHKEQGKLSPGEQTMPCQAHAAMEREMTADIVGVLKKQGRWRGTICKGLQ